MQIDPVQEWQRLTAAYREKSPEELRELARDLADLTETAQQALRSEMHSRGMGDPARSEDFSRDIQNEEKSDDVQDFTWKTPLCECESQQARQLVRALKQAGIETWTGGPGVYARDKDWGPEMTRITVAADQLEQARQIMEKPIPQDIIDDLNAEVPEYEVPKCPKCGTEDPLLESVEPTNHWHCENCDTEWDDPLAPTGGVSEKIADSTS